MLTKAGFALQDQDVELLNYVFQLRLATIDHLAALSGRSTRALWNRLLKLKRHRYLSAVARFKQKHVYGIGSQGALALVEHGYAKAEIADRRLRPRELSEIGIRHSLFIADIHARFLIESHAGGFAIERWEEGRDLWDSVVTRKGAAATPIRPDAYFTLKKVAPSTGKSIHVFLEADRSTMAHSRMATKIEGYLAYYEQRRHSAKYPGMQSFTVFTVTQTRNRADELRQALIPLVPRSSHHAYAFTHFEALSPLSILDRTGQPNARNLNAKQ